MWALWEFGASGATDQQLLSKGIIAGFIFEIIGERGIIMIKILIVDDSIFSQKVTANLIKKYLANTEIYFANDGQQGFEMYKEVKPDYAFLDLLMPKLNGLELIKLIKEYDSAAKIFVVSADVQKNVRKEIDTYNILSFITKPFNEEKAQLACEMIRNEKNE